MKKRQKERKPARRSASDLLAGYEEFLSDLKTSIRSAQIKAALSVNSEMIALYWEIGKGIVERQEKAGWGDDILMRLSSELKHEFPEIQGFSRTNLYRMRALYLAYRSQSENVPQAVGQIPWGHNLVIVEKLKDPAEREWYMQNTIEYGWSRAVLLHQIETRLYQRQAKSREGHQLCAHAAAAAIQHLASGLPYFLTLGKEARARSGTRTGGKYSRLSAEMGAGFAFMGSQYHLEVGGQDFYIDLLFYNHRLRCLVVIDLKMRDFEPGDAGQMSFYLSALDDLVRHSEDHPSVGIILCKGRNQTVAEYTLRDMNKPIGVAKYQTTDELPPDLARALPSPDELERVLGETERTFLNQETDEPQK